MTTNQLNKLKTLSFLDFQQKFPNEESCAQFLFRQRWPNGWACPECNCDKSYWIAHREVYECASCHYQVSVTARTIFHKTRTPLKLWFWAVFFITTDKRGISSVGLSKQLGISQKKAWFMLQKIRQAMSWRESHYQLDGSIELDESFFGAPKEGGPRGRGSSKAKVLVGLSKDEHEKPRFIRLVVLPQINRTQLEPAIQKMVASGARIKTDGLRSYLSLPNHGYLHERIVASETDVLKELHWVHTAISNAKALIGGTYHGLGTKHLQVYLDEFSYRFNRRYRLDQITERCITAMILSPIWTYRDIIDRPELPKPKKKAA